MAFTEEFTEEPSKRVLWSAFLGRTGLDEPETLAAAMALVASLAKPVMKAAQEGAPLPRAWSPGGPWRPFR